MSDRALLKTLSRNVRDYDRAWKRFSANRISESQFDFHYTQLLNTLKRPEAASLFEHGYKTTLAANDNKTLSAIEASEIEQLADFEARFLSDMMGGKNRVKPMIAEGLRKAPDDFPEERVNIPEIFTKAHTQVREIIKESRTKSKNEKKSDKKFVTSIALFIAGVGCVASNTVLVPALIQVSGAAGFTIIGLGCRKLNLD